MTPINHFCVRQAEMRADKQRVGVEQIVDWRQQGMANGAGRVSWTEGLAPLHAPPSMRLS